MICCKCVSVAKYGLKIIEMSARGRSALVPVFVDWVHSFIGVYERFPGYPPPKMDFPRVTATTNCLMAMCLPKMSVQQAMNQSLPLIYFWVNVADGTCDNFAEVAGAITAQYAKVFPRIRVHPRMNPSPDWLGQFLVQTRARPANQRVLAHYCSSVNEDLEEFSKVLRDEALLKTTAFIFECDKCGALSECFEGLKKDVDTFAFFACDKNEVLPKSNDLPIDMFSSCLTSPARMALLWHSRRYYGFQNGPLKPLSMSFVEDEEDGSLDEVFSRIQVTLKHTVEAMAFEVLDSESFLRLFRTDPVVAQLSVNFVLACRVMDFFGVHPRSYPKMPSLVKHRLWDGLDLRLDAELFKLKQPTTDVMTFDTFLQKTIVSLRTLSEVSPLTKNFFPQISFMTSALSCPNTEIQETACHVLARFLDRSQDSIRAALHFPIVPQLFRLLKINGAVPSLLFCLCKVMCYEPAIREMGAGYLLQTAIPLFKNEQCAQLALILCLLFIRNSNAYAASFLQLKGLSYALPLLCSDSSGVRLWALLLISMFIPLLKDTNVRERIFETMRKMNVNSSDEKTALCFCLSQFLIQSDGPLQEKILEVLLGQSNEMCHVVRYQILMGLSFFFQRHPEAVTSPNTDIEAWAGKVLMALTKDPHPMVATMACRISERSGQASLDRQQSIVDGYCAKILTQVHSCFLTDQEAPSISPTSADDVLIVPTAPKRRAIPTMSLVSSYKHSARITSNLSYVSLAPLNQVAFGDETGKVSMKAWAGTDVIKTLTMGKDPVTCIQYLNNYNCPLLAATDTAGNFVAFSLASTVTYPVSGFRLFDDPDVSNTHRAAFDIDLVYGRLAAYRPRLSHQVRLFDIRAEQMLRPIDLGESVIHSLGMITGTSHMGVVSDTMFQMFDLRIRDAVVSLKLNKETIDFRVADPAMLSFMACSKDGYVGMFDIRAGQDAGVVFDMHCSRRVEAMSFDVHPLYQLGVVGHSHGITMFDTVARRTSAITSNRKWFGSQLAISHVSSVLYDRTPQLSISACHNANNIATFTEVLETE